MASTPTSRWLRDEGVGTVPSSTAQLFQSRNSRNMNIMGGNKDLVAKNMGGPSSNCKQNVDSDVVDPFISNRMLQGNQSGFDIIMAHEDEEALATIVDGPKRPRTNPPISGVSIVDSSDVSISVSAGLVKRANREQ
ncbi:hypothetical protein V6N13_129995 [Hibiscus sabdariffa]